MNKIFSPIFICILFGFFQGFAQPHVYVPHGALNQMINVVTGELLEGEIDLQIHGPRSLALQRIYHPQGRINGAEEHGWQFNYPLMKKETPISGDVLLQYDEEGRLSCIQDKHSSSSAIYFNYQSPLKWIVSSHDGQKLRYKFDFHETKTQDQFLLLKKAKLPSGLEWKYQYVEHPLEKKMLISCKKGVAGQCVQTEYYTEEPTAESWRQPGRLRTFSYGKVKSQTRLTDGDPIQIVRLQYSPGKTEVYDALQNKTVYHYNLFNQVTAIEYFLNPTEPYRIERFFWDSDPLIGALIGKSIEDAQGKVWQYTRFTYDVEGKLCQETLYGNLSGKRISPMLKDEHENPITDQIEEYTTTYSYNGNQLQCIQADNGISITFAYEKDLLRHKFYWQNQQICAREFYEYNVNGILTKMSRDDGRNPDCNNLLGATYRHITYLHLGKEQNLPEMIEEKVVPLETGEEILIKKIVLKYDSRNRIISRDFYDESNTYCFSENKSYDKADNPIYTSNPAGVEEQAFDSYQSLLYQRKVDRNGEESQVFNRYDHSHHLLEQTFVNAVQSSTIRNQYDVQGNKIVTEDKLGNKTFFTYDGLNRLIQTTYPAVIDPKNAIEHPVVKYGYDLFDRINMLISPNGGITYTSYNIRGQPIEVIHPDETKESFEYALDGSLKKWKMKNGCSLLFKRDFHGRIIEAIAMDKHEQVLYTTTASYQGENLQSVQGPTGIKTVFQYDCYGKKIGEMIEQKGSFLQTAYHYDLQAELAMVEEWCGLNQETAYSKTVLAKDGHEISVHNHLDEVLQIAKPSKIQPEQEETPYTNSIGQNVLKVYENDAIIYYDALNRPVKKVTNNEEQEFRYDLEGHKVWQKNLYKGILEPQILTWEYDQAGHIIKAAEGDRVVTHRYKDGKLVKTIKPDGSAIHFTYNERGLLERVYAPKGELDYRYQYNLFGQISSVKNEQCGSEVKRAYTPSGLVESEELASGVRLHYTYDSKKRKTSIQFSDDSKIEYKYNPLHLTEVLRTHPDPQKCYRHTYSQYDVAGRLCKSELINEKGQINYHYDDQGQLVEIESPYFSQKSVYDSSTSDMIKTTLGDIQGQFAYDDAHHLIEESWHGEVYTASSKEIDYDLNGNCVLFKVDGQEVRCTYDILDRLIEVSKSSFRVKYQYDGFNRRSQKVLEQYDPHQQTWIASQPIYFLYDENCDIGEFDEKGKITLLRVLGNGLGAEIGAAIAIEASQAVYIPLHDNRGNVCRLVNATTGKVEESYHYTAFGEETIYNSENVKLSNSGVQNPWRFSSKRVEEATGLICFGHRDYSPKMQSWLTPDPLQADPPNHYAFLNLNPMNQVDLYGLFALPATCAQICRQISCFASQKAHELKTTLTTALKNGWKKGLENIIERPFFHLTDFYIYPSQQGIYGRGESCDKVRVSMLNGIMNSKKDYEIGLRVLCETHSGINIHYVFRPTQGFLSDLTQAFMSKLGYTSPHVRELANMWRELIDEMGGIENGGMILHYAHSLGGTDTETAAQLLTPEERKMIRVFTFGSATMVKDNGFNGVYNFVSKRDGVSLFDAVGYCKGIFSSTTNVSFVGTLKGIPFIDHWLCWPAYTDIFKLLGRRFLQAYPSVD